jgi:large repetitive protein
VFNEPIDPVSVNASTTYLYDTQTGVHLAGSMSLDADGRTIVYVPSAALATNRQYYAYAYGVKDLSGNIQYVYTAFTTSFVADTQAPVVLLTSVADGLSNVPTNADLSARFDEPMMELSFGAITLTQNGTPVPVARVPSADRRTVSLQLNQPLQANATYVWTIGAIQDLSGNVLAAPRTITFTTGPGADLTAPGQVSRTPANGATGVSLNPVIAATFNDRINPLSVLDTSVKLYDGTTGQFVAGTPSLSADGLTVRFTPTGALAANRLYYFYTTYNTYLEDLAGNRFNQTTTFTTGAQ